MFAPAAGTLGRGLRSNARATLKQLEEHTDQQLLIYRTFFATCGLAHPRQRSTQSDFISPADKDSQHEQNQEPQSQAPQQDRTHESTAESEAEDSDGFSKTHLGRRSLGTIDLPAELKRSIAKIIGCQDASRLRDDSMRLAQHLSSRASRVQFTAPDIEAARAVEGRIRLVEELMETRGISKSQAQKIVMEEQTRKEIDEMADTNEAKKKRAPLKVIKQVIMPHTMRYGMREALAYLTSRSPGVYGAVYRALTEVADSDESWAPKSLLDFGSGTGMTLWAVSDLWGAAPDRITCVDYSEAMEELSAALLVDPQTGQRVESLGAVEHKRYLPVGATERYDLVTAGFSLCELESAEARVEHVRKLWDLTRGYLVLVEPGNLEGFHNIIEARDLLLGLGREAILIAPCPNSKPCPAANKDEPCHVGQRVGYTPEQLTVLNSQRVKSQGYKMQTFSYVIFARRGNQALAKAREAEPRTWDRLILPPLKRKGHIVCDVCTKEGCLERKAVSRADGKIAFRDVKNRYWGDLLPPTWFYDEFH